VSQITENSNYMGNDIGNLFYFCYQSLQLEWVNITEQYERIHNWNG